MSDTTKMFHLLYREGARMDVYLSACSANTSCTYVLIRVAIPSIPTSDSRNIYDAAMYFSNASPLRENLTVKRILRFMSLVRSARLRCDQRDRDVTRNVTRSDAY